MVEVGGGMRICFVAEGDSSGAPLLLIAGLGQQLNVWPREFRAGLVERGFRVIRSDNRDVGRSGRASAPAPGARQFATRRFSVAQYDLGAMVADTVGLLDALGIERAHLLSRDSSRSGVVRRASGAMIKGVAGEADAPTMNEAWGDLRARSSSRGEIVSPRSGRRRGRSGRAGRCS